MEEKRVVGPSIPHKPVHSINLVKHEVTRNLYVRDRPCSAELAADEDLMRRL